MYNIVESYFHDMSQLLVIINPVTMLSIFIGYVRSFTPKQIKKVALITSAAVLVTLLLTACFGIELLGFFGINLASLQVAGGLALLISCLHQLNSSSSSKEDVSSNQLLIAIVPLCIPIIAGPAAMAKVISLATHEKHMVLVNVLGTSLAVVTVSIVLGVTLFFCENIARIIGNTAINVASRLSYLVLACIGTEMIWQGVKFFIKAG